MKIILQLIYALIVCLTTSLASNRWPKHDISSLKLLQIVHRHGDRAPIGFAPNDPYQDMKYWPQGLGELTSKGKYRMYRLGQYIRQEYDHYLGHKYSTHEVYARSSASHRCIESVSALLAGAYPPQQWNRWSNENLGSIWQPFPIETFIPEKQDIVLEQSKHCPIVSKESQRIYNQSVIKEFERKYSKLFRNLTEIVGSKVADIWTADDLYDTLKIEVDANYYWPVFGTAEAEKKVVDQLYYSQLMGYRYDWDSPIIRRLRAGGLIHELNQNFMKVVNKTTEQLLYVYSTHGEHIGVLMHSLGIFNDRIPPFGATLLFELHQKKDSEYSLRIFYRNSTDISDENPFPMPLTAFDCTSDDCPLNTYLSKTEKLIYDDFNKECVIPDKTNGSYHQNILYQNILFSIFIAAIIKEFI